MQCEFTEKVSLLIDGELKLSEAKQVLDHVAFCRECQNAEEEFLALRQQIGFYSFKPNLAIQRQALSTILASTNMRRWWQPSLAFDKPVFVALSLALLLVVAIGTTVYYRRASSMADLQLPSWQVARLEGKPKVGSNSISKSGRLAIGEWLETDGASRALIDVADIGRVEIDPNSRVRLVETRATEHRLALTRGKIHASIYAPPRLFFVDTPSAVAVDYGCAYTLEVDDAGKSLLHVTAGWVALEAHGRESIVPAGATCATKPGVGPGTPYFEDASKLFLAALTKVDFERSDSSSQTAALDIVLREARRRDGLTLWHLFARVDGAARERVYERLSALVAPPANVTREGILQLDKDMLKRWKDNLELAQSKETF